MKRKELTVRAIENTKAPKSGRLEIWDARIPGFGLRVTPNGAKSFMVMTRINGKQVRKTLGHWPGLKLADARELAGKVKDAARQGRDLLEETRNGHLEAETARKARKTFSDLAEDYIVRETSKLRRGDEIESIIRRELMPYWTARPLVEITPQEVIDRTDALLNQDKPAAANKLFEIIRRLFNWAIKRRVYGLQFSPADRMDPPSPKVIRERVLSPEEIATVWAATEGLGYPFGPFVRLSLVLGQRRDEIAGMQWAEIDLEEKLWTIPTERCKSKRPHIVPLPPQAVAIIESLPHFAGPFLFTTNGGTRPISGYSKFKRRFDKALSEALAKEKMVPLPHWTLHDLRRTMRTGLARLGVNDVVAERVINHAPRGLSAIYDQYQYLDEKRHALNSWAAWLGDLVAPAPEKVVRLHRAAN